MKSVINNVVHLFSILVCLSLGNMTAFPVSLVLNHEQFLMTDFNNIWYQNIKILVKYGAKTVMLVRSN